MKKTSGFTLVEILIATVVLVLGLVGTLTLLTSSLAIPVQSKTSALAFNEAVMKMENICINEYLTIRDGQGSSIAYTNNGALKETPFALASSDLVGSGTVYVNELSGAAYGLMRIKVVVCCRQKNRIIGEDRDLDGILDSGEDANSNGELDSPFQIEKVVVNKEF